MGDTKVASLNVTLQGKVYQGGDEKWSGETAHVYDICTRDAENERSGDYGEYITSTEEKEMKKKCMYKCVYSLIDLSCFFFLQENENTLRVRYYLIDYKAWP